MKLSSILLSVLFATMVAAGCYVFLIADVKESQYLWLFAVLAVVFVVIYIMQAEIDWKWWLRNPPAMPASLERQMAMTMPFYRNLDPIEKKRFRDRVMLWMNGKEHIVMAMDVFPEEVKSMIAANGVMLTFGMEKYLLYPYERVIMYPHPFPSPEHKYLHHSEFFDDRGKHGGTIFNAPPLMGGLTQPLKHYNLVLHEYSGAIIKLYPELEFPEFSEEKITILQQVKGFDIATIEKVVGVKNLDIRQIATEHFFTRPDRFRALLPFDFEQLCQVYNVNPLGGLTPVLNIRKIGFNPLAGM